MFIGVNGIDKLLKTFHSEDVDLRSTIEFAMKNKLIIITDEINDEKLLSTFKQMCKCNEQKMVLWLQLKYGNWYLKRIYQPQLYIEREFNIKSSSDVTAKQLRNKVVVLSDGMGKSTYFTAIVSKIKQSKPSAFILNINLIFSNEMINQLELNDTDDDFNKIVNFILTVINEQQSTLTALILKNMLKSKDHPVYLLFDGFDEISDREHQEHVIKLIKCLWHTNTATMIIVTRSVHLEKLEIELNVLTINFKEFNSRTSNSCDPPVEVASTLKNGAMLLYNYLDFSTGTTVMHFKFSNGSPVSSSPFNTKIYIEEEGGKVIADFNVQNTGGWLKKAFFWHP
ncbi:hypothetical protein CHUAL_012082 [Chamberlinius hualienensis]